MTGSRINRLIVGIVLMALTGSFFTGAAVAASEQTLTVDSRCICAAPAGCGNSESEIPSACMDMSASSECRCSISPMPETKETPAVKPVTTRLLDISSLVAVLPEQARFADRPQYAWVVTSEQIIYNFFYSSSPDGRAPPV